MTEELADYDVQFGGFDRLMPFRVHEILMVASPYDAFIIAEDDRLTELIFSEYLDLNLKYAPTVTRVSTAKEGLVRLRTRSFDLVITMSRVGSMEMGAFAKSAGKICPGLPVVLLAYNMEDVERLRKADLAPIDRIFLWGGDSKLLLAIIKHIEDRRNLDEDLKNADVQVILLVEDSVRFYSYYLPLIYTELMKQTQRLISEGVNLSHKLLRTRARPKILLATSLEQAWELYEKYRSNMLGVITDVGLPSGKKHDPEAGLELLKRLRKERPDLPVMLQSSNRAWAKKAKELGAVFLRKDSRILMVEIRRFLMEHCGFGDFVFRKPDGEPVSRVSDLHSMVETLRTVPDDTLLFHANANHFSKWLLARTEFELAYRIRPRKISEFKDADTLRKFIIDTMVRFLHGKELGTVSDFSRRFFMKETPFVKIGGGSLGGKARGLAFLNSLLSRHDLSHKWEGVVVQVPNAAVLATDLFDAFLERNLLYRKIQAAKSDEEIRQLFLKAELPEEAARSLETYVSRVRHPLAVRSSSLLEDSAVRPFAGIYDTFMLPNNHPDQAVRLKQVVDAVKLVYASTFSYRAQTYLGSTPHLQAQERMAVILQRLVGEHRGSSFYPTFAGVAQSYNYYPVGAQKAKEGIAHVALGLGETIVKGRMSLSFSPAHPKSLYQFSSVKDCLKNSQREFVALDMDRKDYSPGADPSGNLKSLYLDTAEADGTLADIGSTYSAENDRIYEGVSRPGTRLVTFANILNCEGFPLIPILEDLFELGTKAAGSPVEIEFAVDLKCKEFAILQMRPMLSWERGVEIKITPSQRDKAICYSPRTLGHGRPEGISDIVFVKPEIFDSSKTRLIAKQIGELNIRMMQEERGYVLIGPGRWGSADPLLGIPINWENISAAKVIVETSLEGFVVEPSYGTHFLHNVIAFETGYFTVKPEIKEGRIDWDWLTGREPIFETELIRHVHFDSPLDIRIDGRTGRGAILRPS